MLIAEGCVGCTTVSDQLELKWSLLFEWGPGATVVNDVELECTRITKRVLIKKPGEYEQVAGKWHTVGPTNYNSKCYGVQGGCSHVKTTRSRNEIVNHKHWLIMRPYPPWISQICNDRDRDIIQRPMLKANLADVSKELGLIPTLVKEFWPRQPLRWNIFRGLQ